MGGCWCSTAGTPVDGRTLDGASRCSPCCTPDSGASPWTLWMGFMVHLQQTAGESITRSLRNVAGFGLADPLARELRVPGSTRTPRRTARVRGLLPPSCRCRGTGPSTTRDDRRRRSQPGSHPRIRSTFDLPLRAISTSSCNCLCRSQSSPRRAIHHTRSSNHPHPRATARRAAPTLSLVPALIAGGVSRWGTSRSAASARSGPRCHTLRCCVGTGQAHRVLKPLVHQPILAICPSLPPAPAVLMPLSSATGFAPFQLCPSPSGWCSLPGSSPPSVIEIPPRFREQKDRLQLDVGRSVTLWASGSSSPSKSPTATTSHRPATPTRHAKESCRGPFLLQARRPLQTSLSPSSRRGRHLPRSSISCPSSAPAS